MNPVDRLRALGGELFLDGERVRYRIPKDSPEAREVLAELRRQREAIAAMVRDSGSEAPSPAEVSSMLPPGVRLMSYQPKYAPFAVSPVSAVTNAGKFYRAYLADLSQRLAQPLTHSCPPLADILSKLADAGLLLEVRPGV